VSLIHYVKPFLEEYCMARKTTGNTTPNRSKKTEASIAPAAVQVAPEVHKQVAPEVRKNAKPANLVPVNLEEEIRCRAHELYLQRRGTAGDQNGDPNQDWLIAEREIRSRYGIQERDTA
jgi:Protein of unknown function (DUF2934)